MKLARLRTATSLEPYWHVQVAVLVAIALQVLLDDKLSIGPKYAVASIELVLLVALSIFVAQVPNKIMRLRRILAIMLIALVSLANISSLVLIIHDLLGSRTTSGKELLGSGLAIYLTNIIIFGLWYWELDDPEINMKKGKSLPSPDFLFPQLSVSPRTSWRPTFLDYLYISVTNATAFSPTDTLPLTHRAKLLMTLQSLTSLVTVALVAARAVNILT